MNLIKIYDKDCAVCNMLSGIDEEIADDNGFFFRQITLDELAGTPSNLRDYVKGYHVDDNGMIGIPIYLIVTDQDQIQASGVVRTVEELTNLVKSFKTWEASRG
jgi:hypothetical protein